MGKGRWAPGYPDTVGRAMVLLLLFMAVETKAPRGLQSHGP